MFKKLMPLFALPLMVLAGCSALSGSGANKALAAEPELQGVWKMDMSAAMDKGAGKNEVAASFGKAFASMFDNVKLKFMSGERFKLSMLSIPIEGHYTINGSHLKLTPEKVAGKTPEELKTMQKTNPVAMSMKPEDMSSPMDAEMSPDKQSITVHTAKSLTGTTPKPEDIVFKKMVQKAVANTLKSDSEKEIAGAWTGSMTIAAKPGATAQDKQKMDLAKAMMNNIELELRTDNTFALDMFMHLEGTWAVEGKNVALHPSMAGAVSKDKPLTLTISPDSKALTMVEKKEGTLTFMRDE